MVPPFLERLAKMDAKLHKSEPTLWTINTGSPQSRKTLWGKGAAVRKASAAILNENRGKPKELAATWS